MSYTEHLDDVVEAIGNMVTLAELQLAGPVAYNVFLGGDLTMRKDLSIAVSEDAAFVHSLTLPIATALLALYFQSLRIMLIPLITIALSITASFLIMYGVTRPPAWWRRHRSLATTHSTRLSLLDSRRCTTALLRYSTT